MMLSFCIPDGPSEYVLLTICLCEYGWQVHLSQERCLAIPAQGTRLEIDIGDLTFCDTSQPLLCRRRGRDALAAANLVPSGRPLRRSVDPIAVPRAPITAAAALVAAR